MERTTEDIKRLEMAKKVLNEKEQHYIEIIRYLNLLIQHKKKYEKINRSN